MLDLDKKINILHGFRVRFESMNGTVGFGAVKATNADGASVRWRAYWDKDMYGTCGAIKSLRITQDDDAMELCDATVATLVRRGELR